MCRKKVWWCVGDISTKDSSPTCTSLLSLFLYPWCWNTKQLLSTFLKIKVFLIFTCLLCKEGIYLIILYNSYNNRKKSYAWNVFHYIILEEQKGFYWTPWLMSPEQYKISVLHPRFCDSSWFTVNLMKNYYTSTHIKNHTRTIHLSANLNLLLFARTCFQLEKIYITHPVLAGYLQRDGRSMEANAWRYSREWNSQNFREGGREEGSEREREGGRWRGIVRRLAISHCGP